MSRARGDSTLRNIIITTAVSLGLAVVALVTVTGCGSNAPTRHYSANLVRNGSLVTVQRTTTLTGLQSDAAICKIYNRDIGSGDLQPLARAVLAAGTSVSFKLRHDLATSVTDGSTLQSALNGQVSVTMDCAEVKVGKIPR